MLIHIQTKNFIDTIANNGWDKIYFLQEDNPQSINSIDIRCNRTLLIDSQEFNKLLGRLIYDRRSYAFKYQYFHSGHFPDMQKSIEYHGHINLNQLNYHFKNKIIQNTPSQYNFYEVGLSADSVAKIKKYGGDSGSIDIKFQNQNYPNINVILNLQIQYVMGFSAQDAINQINSSLEDFLVDEGNLIHFRDVVNLDNFESYHLDVDKKSLDAVMAYVGEDFVNCLNLRI